MPVILKRYESATWPVRAEHISAEEVEKLEKAGKVYKAKDGIYHTRVMVAEKVVKVVEPEAEEKPAAKPAGKKATRKKTKKASK